MAQARTAEDHRRRAMQKLSDEAGRQLVDDIENLNQSKAEMANAKADISRSWYDSAQKGLHFVDSLPLLRTQQLVDLEDFLRDVMQRTAKSS